MRALQIRLYNVPVNLSPGDPVECTVGGMEHDCEFVEYSAQGEMFGRKIIVEIAGVHETKKGVVRPDMFDSLIDEFYVNTDRNAGTGYWQH